MRNIKEEIERHRNYVRLKLKEYVKKIGSYLANLKRWNFQYVHNDLYEIEYRLDQIEGIVQGRGYRQAVHNIWKNFVRARGERLSDSLPFANFVQKLKDFQRKKSEICGQIESIRGKIKGIRSSLSKLQTKIPDFGDNDYKEEWRLMDKIKDFKVGPTNLLPVITSLNIQIREATEEFMKIQEKIKTLQESIEPFEKHIEAQIITDIKGTITDQSFDLEKVIDRVAKLGVGTVMARHRLDSALGIFGYLNAIAPKNFSFEEPEVPGLENIEDFKTNIEKNVAALKKMEDFIKAYFKHLRKKNVLLFVPAVIRNNYSGSKKIFQRNQRNSRRNSKKT